MRPLECQGKYSISGTKFIPFIFENESAFKKVPLGYLKLSRLYVKVLVELFLEN